MQALIKHSGKTLEGNLNLKDNWFEVLVGGIPSSDLGCYELHSIELLVAQKDKCSLHVEKTTDMNGMYKWEMRYNGVTEHSIYTAELSVRTLPERVQAHWDGFTYNKKKANSKLMQAGYTFAKWSEVFEMMKKERKKVEREFDTSHGDVFKFHYEGILAMIDGERGDKYYGYNVSLGSLKQLVADVTKDHPNSKIEISLEGHYDWWPDYKTYFEDRHGGYEPSDVWIDIVLWTNH